MDTVTGQAGTVHVGWVNEVRLWRHNPNNNLRIQAVFYFYWIDLDWDIIGHYFSMIFRRVKLAIMLASEQCFEIAYFAQDKLYKSITQR